MKWKKSIPVQSTFVPLDNNAAIKAKFWYDDFFKRYQIKATLNSGPGLRSRIILQFESNYANGAKAAAGLAIQELTKVWESFPDLFKEDD